MPEFEGFQELTENWTRMPNQIVDAFPIMTKAELMVVLYVMRHTLGYQDESKRITLDEFEHGRKYSPAMARKRGRDRIDNGVGLSEPSIRDGIRRAVEHGFIIQEREPTRDLGRQSYLYGLAFKDEQAPCARDKESYPPRDKESCPPRDKESCPPRVQETLPRSEKDTEKETKKEHAQARVSSESEQVKDQDNPTPEPTGEALLEQYFGPRPVRDDPPANDNAGQGWEARRARGEPDMGSWAVPAAAGGSDPPAGVILEGVCQTHGLTPGQLPDKRCKAWTRAIRGVIDEWVPDLTAAEARLAWRAWQQRRSWQSAVNPYAKGFTDQIGPLLAAVRSGAITDASLDADAVPDRSDGPDLMSIPLIT